MVFRYSSQKHLESDFGGNSLFLEIATSQYDTEPTYKVDPRDGSSICDAFGCGNPTLSGSRFCGIHS